MKIAWLEDPNCQDVACVGGKVANLSRLAADHRYKHARRSAHADHRY